MRIYLDNCCFNRPFDDQSQSRIQTETEAKLKIQALVQAMKVELVWSYILEHENAANPFPERRDAIVLWKQRATVDVSENEAVLMHATDLNRQGIRPKDALHLASAITSDCDYFITTDDILLRRTSSLATIRTVTPQQFLSEVTL
ncbi:MAG TPA: PIN domain-containing protein [Phycisphaerae bacterium]|nr:PIN domain-containing protein [Phycisphaerae bacterium]